MRSLIFILIPLLLVISQVISGQEPVTIPSGNKEVNRGLFQDTVLPRNKAVRPGMNSDSVAGKIQPADLLQMPDTVQGDILIPVSVQPADSVITLLFTGDIMGHDGQILAARDDSAGTYSYDSVFKYISPLLSAVDIATGNLEVTLGGRPYKGYPAFSSPDELAVACRNAGFDILVTANNHAADRGPKGISRTIRVLDSLGVSHTGTWISSEARDSLSPLIINHDSIRIALLAYTYGTNGIVVPPPATVAYIDTLRAAKDIARAKALGADVAVVFIHWGIEYDTVPSGAQKKTAEALQRTGADVIIGSHPHVVQPMNAVKDSAGIRKPVVWSMGNFVSNQRTRRRDGGVMIRLDLSVSLDTVVISDAGYVLTWVYTPVEKGKKRFYILPCSEFENKPEFFRTKEQYEAMMLYIRDARRLLDNLNTGFREMTFADGLWVAADR